MPAPTSPHNVTCIRQLRGCAIWIWAHAHKLETRYPDGTKAPAKPEATRAYRRTTARLGYGTDMFRQMVEHELSHSLLAEARGLRASPVLWAVAHGLPMPKGSRREEDAVLSFQAWCQGDADALELLELDGWDVRELEALRAELWRHAR